MRHSAPLGAVILAAGGVVAGAALAQDAAAPALQGEAAEPGAIGTDCGDAAGLYLGPKGLKLWVTRQGFMIQDNPLRPLTRDQFVILEVVVNGRLASAYGPDFQTMRRGAPPGQLEAGGETRIAWEAKADGLPQTIRIVSEDGSVVLGPIQFSTCADAPKVAQPVVRRPPRAAPPAADSRPSVLLPQGAIP